MAVTTTGNVTFKVSITDTVAAGALRSSAVSGAAEIDASHKWNAGAGAALEINLVSYNKNDLLKFRNFGKKSLTELEDLVENKGLSFGMNVSKYKLDKE